MVCLVWQKSRVWFQSKGFHGLLFSYIYSVCKFSIKPLNFKIIWSFYTAEPGCSSWVNWIHAYKRLKSKFTIILFVYNFMIGCSKRIGEKYPKKCFWAKLRRFVLIDLRTTGPWETANHNAISTRQIKTTTVPKST